MGRCIKELERIYGIRNGSAGGTGQNQYTKLEPKVSDEAQSPQKQLAGMIEISVDTLQNYKKLAELVSELQDWVETGVLAPATAFDVMRSIVGIY